MSSDQQMIGRYRIVERVGRGGMGVLYRGIDPVLDREVAIKVMSADFAEDTDDDARARFFREARGAAKLQHRNIVTIFEFAEEGGTPYIVMEFLRGRSLSARMVAEPALTLDEKLDIVTELCSGLAFAHENGVVHRDVKPANVWLLEDGTVKLLDFGIAKTSSSTLTRHGDVLGSASYMSPEQISGSAVDGRADVFSAAVVLYELLAGCRPFESDSPTSTILKIMQDQPPPLDTLVADLPVALVAAVAKGLEKNPSDRYQTAGDFGADLHLIRMSLQSTGDTVFGGDLAIGETLHAPLPETLVAERSLRESSNAKVPALSPKARTGRPSTRVWMLSAAAGVLIVAGVGWFGAARLTSSKSPSTPPSATGPAAPAVQRAVQAGAAEPEEPKSQARLRVTSEPDGANIDLDGRDTGLTTPVDLPLGDSLPTRIRLMKKGFQPLEAELTGAILATGSVSYRLPPAELANVRLTATGSYPFEVLDGKRVLSKASMSHELTVPAARILKLRASAHLLDYPFKVETGGRTMQVEAPELGRLTVRSAMETCQVSVSGHDIGFPPINSQPVAAGTYSIQLKCSDGQIIRGSSVTIVAGQTLIAKVP